MSFYSILLFLIILFIIYFYSQALTCINPYTCVSIQDKNNYLIGIDIIYWINLRKSQIRRKEMEKIFQDSVFNNIKIKRIDAIDGKSTNIDSILNQNFINIQEQNTKVEYACLLSHLNTIYNFSKSDNKIALIMEDDMTLEYKPYWKESITQIINKAPHDWEIIQLCYISQNTPTNLYSLNDGIFFSTGAYLINQKGAHKIKKHNNLYTLNKNINHTADEYLFKTLITYTYKYPLFIYKYNNNSTIHNNHISTIHNPSKVKIDKIIYNCK